MSGTEWLWRWKPVDQGLDGVKVAAVQELVRAGKQSGGDNAELVISLTMEGQTGAEGPANRPDQVKPFARPQPEPKTHELL